MKKEKPVQQFIGLAYRAGEVVSGESAVQKALAENKACLLLLAEDASGRTRDKFVEFAVSRNIAAASWGSKFLLGQLLQKPPRSVVAITDENFARGMLRALERGEGLIMSGLHHGGD